MDAEDVELPEELVGDEADREMYKPQLWILLSGKV